MITVRLYYESNRRRPKLFLRFLRENLHLFGVLILGALRSMWARAHLAQMVTQPCVTLTFLINIIMIIAFSIWIIQITCLNETLSIFVFISSCFVLRFSKLNYEVRTPSPTLSIVCICGVKVELHELYNVNHTCTLFPFNVVNWFLCLFVFS